MTTINVTKDELYNLLGPVATGGPMTNFDVGSSYTRVSSGGDRSTPPQNLWTPVSFMTRPYLRRGVVVKPAEQKFKKVWKKPPRRAVDEEHSYSAVHRTIECTAGLAVKRLGAWYNLGTPFNWDLSTIPDPWSDSDQNALLGKLRTAVAGSSFNAGVALAESPRAFTMIAHSTTKIYSAYRAVRRGDPVSAARILTGKAPPQGNRLKSSPRAAASNWLELQYGWFPLLSDVYDASVYMDHRLRHPVVHRVAVRQYGSGVIAREYDFVVPTGYASVPVYVSSSTRLVAKLKDVDQTGLVGLQDPASIAWELVPFSFVLDWFIPVGTWLENQALQRSLTGTYIMTHKFEVRFARKKAKTIWELSDLNSGSKMFYRRTTVVRTISTSLSIPVPSIKPLKSVASVAHAANAVALLINSKR